MAGALVTGYRAQYETLNQIFSISSLSARSLTLYQSLLGFGREIGYFAFTGAETWYSYPWLPLWGYYAFAPFVPLLAYSALRWHRDRRTVFLVLAAVLATLAAPGTRRSARRAVPVGGAEHSRCSETSAIPNDGSYSKPSPMRCWQA